MAGNIRVIEPKENFQRVSKDIIFNDAVDYATLGLYVKVISLGKKWDLNVNGLAGILKVSIAKIRASLALLEREGYVKRVLVKDDKSGKFIGYDYHIGVVPFPEDERTDTVAAHTVRREIHPTENPSDGKTIRRKIHPTENPSDGKPDGINRDYSVDEDSKEIETKTIERGNRSAFSAPTLEDVTRFVADGDYYLVDPEVFFNHYASNGWMVGKSRMKDWKAAVRSWNARKRAELRTPAPEPLQAKRSLI